MNKKQELFSWIDYSDNTQCEWALNYLETRKLAFKSRASTQVDQLRKSVQSINSDRSDAEKILLNQQMRAAWNQKKNRSRTKGRKAYSFIMSTDIERMLKNLARDKGKPINKVLESIIENANQFKADIEDVIRKRIESVNTGKENSWMRQKEKADKVFQSNKHQLVKLDAENKLQHDEIANLVFEKLKCELYFQKNNIDFNELDFTCEERAKLMDDRDNLIRFHFAEVESKLRRMGISL